MAHLLIVAVHRDARVITLLEQLWSNVSAANKGAIADCVMTVEGTRGMMEALPDHKVCSGSSGGFGDSGGDVLICGCRGVDATAVVANTGFMARSVLILGFPGVQALDLVGPSEVFTSSTICLQGMGRADDGYDVRVVSPYGEPATTGTGLALIAEPLPDPRGPVDTIVLPGGFGTDAARQNPDVIGWIRIAAESIMLDIRDVEPDYANEGARP
jgi:hypothetical protein